MTLTEQELTELLTLIRRRAQILVRQQWRVSDMDEDDLAQELFLRVWQRLQSFNAARAKWETFCGLIVTQGVLNLFRRHLTPGRQRVHQRCASLSAQPDLLNEKSLASAGEITEWELAEDVNVFLDRLLTDERRLAESLREKCLSAAQRDLGLSRRRLQTLMRKFRSLLTDLDLLDV